MNLRQLLVLGVLGVVAGALFVQLETEPDVLVRRTASPQTERQASSPLPQERIASAATPGFSSASMPSRGAEKAVWETALKRARAEPVTASIHRAAVTGDVIDIATARWMRGVYCKDANVSTDYLKSKGMPVTAEVTDYLSRLKEQCNRAGMRSPAGIPVKSDRGFGINTQNFIEAASGAIVPDAEERRSILKRVVETGSIQLLEVASSLITSKDLYDLGLKPAQGIPPVIDHALVQLAIKIAACNSRGDCDQVAFRELECGASNACVKDLRDFPRERIYGPKDARATLVSSLNVDSEQLELRWRSIEKFVAGLL